MICLEKHSRWCPRRVLVDINRLPNHQILSPRMAIHQWISFLNPVEGYQHLSGRPSILRKSNMDKAWVDQWLTAFASRLEAARGAKWSLLGLG